ncbi:dihydrodipicolinate synthase family protein [Monashia sp. NPDC004114]
MVTLPRGTYAALATPVTDDGTLDRDGLERLVERVVAGGVDGISPCGSTGEGPRLTLQQRLEVTRSVVAASPATVVAGISWNALQDAYAELEALGDIGVHGALVAPPSYFPSTDSELVAAYGSIADRSPVPVVLYNIPMFARSALGDRVVAELMTHPNIVGIKDSSRDLEYLGRVLEARRRAGLDDSFRVFTGTDTLLVASLLAGADGCIAASVNLVPELSRVIVDSVETDLAGALGVQDRLTAVVYACRRGSPPAGWKAALHAVGVCGPGLVPPAIGLGTGEISDVRGRLAELGVGGARP